MHSSHGLKDLAVQRDKIDKFINSLSELLGISFFVVDSQGDYIVEPVLTIEHCLKDPNAKAEKNKCSQEFINLFAEVKRTKSPLSSSCYLGKYKFATPIIYKEEFLGAAIGCRAAKNPASLPLGRISEIVNQRFANELEIISLTREIFSNHTEIALLYEIGEIFGKVLDVEEASKIILERILELTDAQRISLMLLDRDTNKLKIVYSKGIPDEIARKTMVHLGERISGSVAMEGKPILVENIEEDQNIKSKSIKDGQFKTSSFISSPLICSPLKLENKVVGVINIADKKSGESFTQHDLDLLSVIGTQIAALIENKRLFNDIKDLFLTTIKALSLALDAKDHYTYGHAQEVTKCALAIADELNLSAEIKADIELASILHDIGKIAIPETILLKPGTLTKAELKEVRKHPVRGAEILQDIKQLENIVPAILYHHERHDGTGYPMGLKEDQIPLLAKILSVADAYDAMTSERSYRSAMSKEQAALEIKNNRGTQFDPEVADAFEKAYQKGKI